MSAARKSKASSIRRAPLVGNAEASVGGMQTTLRMEVKFSDLSVGDRRALFAALLQDEQVVTAARFTSESIDLHKAVEAACKWETYTGVK